MSFPNGFLWGGSVSAAQIEGAWNEDGKSPVQIDYAATGTNSSFRPVLYRRADGTMGSMTQFGHLPEGARYELFENQSYTNHFGSDFYHRYKEDIALLAEMGYTTFNTTISWARIYPRGMEGGVNPKGIEFYRDVFTELHKYHIDPVITLYKYDEPVYFEEKYGGWQDRAMIDEFVTFARTCFVEYKNLVNKWITFNEIQILQHVGNIPGSGLSPADGLTALHHQLVASARAVKVAHEIDPALRVGCMAAGMTTYPLTCDPADVMLAYKSFQDSFCYAADTFMFGEYPSFAPRLWREYDAVPDITEQDRRDLKEGTADFIAFSYYMSSAVTTHKNDDRVGGNITTGVRNPYLKYSDWGWAMDPIGFKYFLHVLNDRYHKPIFDVENGLGACDQIAEDGGVHDDYRIEYHRDHIRMMKEAVEEGVQLFGYTTWGCIDLVAFSTGQVSKRYGMIYVDVDDEGNGTMKRLRKDSFYWYQKVIRSNGEDLE